MSFLIEILKLAGKPIFDVFMKLRADETSKQADLNRFYVELGDIRDKSVEAIRILANEHNRRNDPSLRNGRPLSSFGPSTTPFRIEFFALRPIFEKQYDRFNRDQRSALAELFDFAEDYNQQLVELRALSNKTFDIIPFDFTSATIIPLTAIVFLASRLVEFRERYGIQGSEAGKISMQRVLDGYGIRLYNAQFEFPE